MADWAALELETRRCCEAGDTHGAATLVIQELGPELLGFLVVLIRDRSDAGEVFADVCVRIWKGLPAFRWESSLRTWCYVLTRRAAAQQRKSRDAWKTRHVPLSDAADLEPLIVRIRTTTLAGLREQRRTRAERLREQLSEDEQALLTLRVDRGLEWRDLAQVLADHPLDDGEITRAAAALRKRFERLKERLRTLAAEDEAKNRG
ncbi:MAG TPA: sigma-70 family RNA polymerase sigma factor [Kofleriaceae bacterium]|nr:sigma-70 family RNA polymerase sigma factor [Kofleriaceae bacterium]